MRERDRRKAARCSLLCSTNEAPVVIDDAFSRALRRERCVTTKMAADLQGYFSFVLSQVRLYSVCTR